MIGDGGKKWKPEERATKTVFAWVVTWPEICTPRVSIDLFFSSRSAFHAALGREDYGEQLVPIEVPADFDDNMLDFIPEQY